MTSTRPLLRLLATRARRRARTCRRRRRCLLSSLRFAGLLVPVSRSVSPRHTGSFPCIWKVLRLVAQPLCLESPRQALIIQCAQWMPRTATARRRRLAGGGCRHQNQTERFTRMRQDSDVCIKGGGGGRARWGEAGSAALDVGCILCDLSLCGCFVDDGVALCAASREHGTIWKSGQSRESMGRWWWW